MLIDFRNSTPRQRATYGLQGAWPMCKAEPVGRGQYRLFKAGKEWFVHALILSRVGR